MSYYPTEVSSLLKCVNCKKPSIVQCDGCLDYYCATHIREHRQHLDRQFARLRRDRSKLPHKIVDYSAEIKQTRLKAFLVNVNEWEEQALKSVRQTADRVRARIMTLMTTRTSSIKADLDYISAELRNYRTDNNYFEHDIKQLNEKISYIQFNLDRQRSRLKLNIPPINLNLHTSSSLKYGTPRSEEYFPDGTLLCQEHQMLLNEFCNKQNQMWRLIYKATRDGFSSDDFYRCCDRKGPTMTVIQSSSAHIFGGYTSMDWRAREEWTWLTDKNAFLFTLINPYGISPTKYRINAEGRNAIGCKQNMGPTFGSYDISVHSNCNQNNRSNIAFPTDYIDSTGKGRLTFTGSHYFNVAEIEVYAFKNN